MLPLEVNKGPQTPPLTIAAFKTAGDGATTRHVLAMDAKYGGLSSNVDDNGGLSEPASPTGADEAFVEAAGAPSGGPQQYSPLKSNGEFDGAPRKAPVVSQHCQTVSSAFLSILERCHQ